MELYREIVLAEFGSFVYGTNVPTSDHDFKGVFLPHPKEILLQRASKTSRSENTKQDPNAKNSAEDIDREWFTLQGYIRLLSEGQTPALDLLFTPRKFLIRSSREWKFLQDNRSKLVHRGTASFVGYCQTQAAKYGIKGSRVAAMRKTLELLRSFPDPKAKLNEHADAIKAFATFEHAAVVDCKGPQNQLEPHLEVCNRKIPFHARVEYAIEVYQRIFDEYGHRAKQAESNENVDWKALCHAVRVCEEAKELLQTGQITFPRPEKELLLRIRKQEMPYARVARMIEEGLEDVLKIKEASTLPTSIDLDFWYGWVAEIYADEIKSLYL